MDVVNWNVIGNSDLNILKTHEQQVNRHALQNLGMEIEDCSWMINCIVRKRLHVFDIIA